MRVLVRQQWLPISVLVAGMAVSFAGAAQASATDPFPEILPSTRAQALDHLADAEVVRLGSLTGRLLETRRSRPGSQAGQRALSLLWRRPSFVHDEVLPGPGGLLVRYTSDATSVDRIDPTDADGDGSPDVAQAVLRGLSEARALFVDRLELPAPPGLEVYLVRLGHGLGGYTVPPAPRVGNARLVLEAHPAGGPDAARRAAIRQYAQAVALATGLQFPAGWSEALGVWAGLAIDGTPEQRSRNLLSERLARMGSGLLADSLELSAGNALWLVFLEEAYGPTSVRLAVEELARGGSISTALDNAVRRVSSDDLTAALREFHVWTVLVGEWSDGHHFSFAADLAGPRFASEVDGLPALSVQADPALAALGTAQVRLRPATADGGLRVHFDGDFSASWGVDLLLVQRDGSKRRLAVPLDDGRAETTVPLDGVVEAWLLIRNLGGEARTLRRYTYSAHHETGFPYELTSLAATRTDSGILVAWETDAETHLFGFNVVRRRETAGTDVTVNPVWIPALGRPTEATSYRFLDRSAEPGVHYLYRIEGITLDGLTSPSAAVPTGPAPRRR